MVRLGCLLIILGMVGLCAVIVIPILPFFEDSAAIDGFLLLR